LGSSIAISTRKAGFKYKNMIMDNIPPKLNNDINKPLYKGFFRNREVPVDTETDL
jgi:hypothetical protein